MNIALNYLSIQNIEMMLQMISNKSLDEEVRMVISLLVTCNALEVGVTQASCS